MTINATDKLRTVLEIYGIIHHLPGWRQAFKILINPMDSTRYVEFAHLLRFLDKKGFRPQRILDVSSPYILSYVLSKTGKVIKTDINPGEGKFIREGKNLSFRPEDATRLSFGDDSFDLVCSISVIEHIHGNYLTAVREMARVTRPGGYLYLTFPVSSTRMEEWLEEDPYGVQHRAEGRWFFQYRFSEEEMAGICSASSEMEVLDQSVYWERKAGPYNRVMEWLRKDYGVGKINVLKNSLVNLASGIFLLDNRPAEFRYSKSFGNASIVLRKKPRADCGSGN
jgi:SAM-dependent methyltransferase